MAMDILSSFSKQNSEIENLLDGLIANDTIIIIALSCLTSIDSSKPIQKRISVNHESLSTNIPSEEPHPVTDPLGENSRNPARNRRRAF